MGGGGGPSTKKIKKQADYQFQLNQQAAQKELEANRVNQTTPWGSVSWNQDPATGKWSQTTTLDPAEQQRLDQQRGMLTGLGDVAKPIIGQVGNAIQDSFKLGNIQAQGPTGAPTGPQLGQVGQGPQLSTNFGNVDPDKLAQMGQAQMGQLGSANTFGGASAGPASQAGFTSAGPASQAGFTSAGEAAQFGGASHTAERAKEYELQQKLDTSGLSNMPEASEAVRQQTIDAMYRQAQSRLQPQFEQQRREALDRLYAMGGREGDPMFEQQKANLERQITDANQQALWNAIGAGGQEQSRLFGLGMAQRQQGFNEALQGGQFTNEALMNQFQQGAFNAGQGNQVGMANAANATQAGIASMNAANQMNQFNAGQQNAMGQFNAGQANDLSQFNAGQSNQMGMFNAGNQQQAGLANMAANNQFDLARFNAENANNQFNAGQGLQGMLAGLNYNRQGTVLGNEALQQGFQNQLAGTGFNNQAAQQGFQNQLAQNQEQSRIRNEQIQQALLERGVPMSELGAVLGMMGQVQNPQFGGYAQANIGSPDYLNAYMQGQQMKAQGQQGMMSGIGSLAGSLGSAAILASDRRLKKNIRPIGKTAGGHNLYQYEYKFGGPGQVGVMADEVPEAKITVNGIDFVDYSKVK